MGCNVRVWPRVWSVCSQSRGENVRRSQVSERDERRDLHLSGAVTRLCSCVHQRGDCVVPMRASPTAQQVAWAGTAGALLLVHKEQA